MIDQIRQSQVDDANGQEIWTSLETLKARAEQRRQRERSS
jgi:hypothetical protein